jgi:nucleotide-binding universal stress UspA family protein
MKMMVGYNGSPASKRALDMACQEAKKADAVLYVVTSMMGGSSENIEDVQHVQDLLDDAKKMLAQLQVKNEMVQLVRGLSPGEDLVKYAEDNHIGHIFLGIEKKSRTRKILLGSTAQYVILKGPCPVTTIK